MFTNLSMKSQGGKTPYGAGFVVPVIGCALPWAIVAKGAGELLSLHERWNRKSLHFYFNPHLVFVFKNCIKNFIRMGTPNVVCIYITVYEKSSSP